MFDHGILTLQRARIGGTAVPAFTIYNVEAVRAVCLAAEQSGSPVILQVGSSSYRQTSLRMMAAAAMAAAEEASVPVGVHLDHSVDVDEARMCIDLGYSSVMIDGSHLSFEDNVAITKSVVEIAHDAGVWVEGELGAVAGDEDESTGAQAAPSTDPAQAAEFAERTGVDALAIAIGTVHGFSDVPPDLDLGTLRDVARRVPIPLVLHGASGVEDSQLASAISLGIAKVNINAELRRAFFEGMAEGLRTASDSVPSLQASVIATMTDLALSKCLLLSGRTAASTALTENPCPLD